MLESEGDVVRCLTTYTDWWQPSSTSVMRMGGTRRGAVGADGLHPGLVETLDERSELCRRMGSLEDRDRQLLFLWYVRYLPAASIARALGIGRRQCFRRRADAIRAIVELGCDTGRT